MKFYTAQQSLSYHMQDQLRHGLEGIFMQMLENIGSTIIKQVYADIPEAFSQVNKHNECQTEYRAELCVITREEARVLQTIQQRRI